jgi:DNA-binding beta-propeller fold protein YncE
MAHAAGRRIDLLDTTRTNACTVIQSKCDAALSCAAAAKESIRASVAEKVAALEKRRDALCTEVDQLLEMKVKMLKDQAQKITAGLPDCDSKASLTNDVRLRTDEVISYDTRKVQELDELIANFGQVSGSSTYASESRVVGPLIEGASKVNHKTWMLITAKDLQGKQRTKGGDNIIVKFDDDGKGEEHFECQVEDLNDGTYKVHVVPKSMGSYTVTVSVKHPPGMEGDEIIPGSPFKVKVDPPFDYTVLGDDAMGKAGQPWVDNEVGFLRHPLGIALDPKFDFAFVADQNNNRIQVFRYPTKEAICTYGKKGHGHSAFNQPGYIAIDRNDQIFVSDILNHRLQLLKFNREEKTLRHVHSIGGPGVQQGQFNFPRGVALSNDGLLIVADSQNHRIQILDTNKDCSFVRAWGDQGKEEGKLDEPKCVVVNSSNEVFVTDAQHRVQVFDLEGAFLRSWGKKGRKMGQFKHPAGLAVDNEDKVFVCDQGNNRVQVFDKDGEFCHAWGGHLVRKLDDEGNEIKNEDGEAEDAEWYGLLIPSGISVSASGNVLVSDYGKHVVFDF